MARTAGSGLLVKLVGDIKLRRLMKSLPNKDVKKAIRKAARAGAKIITAETKSLAPVGETKRLRRAIKTRAAKRSRKYIGVVTSIGEGNFQGDTFYGAFVEFGHKVGARKLANRAEVEGQGFMLKAAKNKKRAAGAKAAEVLKSELIAAARKGK